MESRMSRVQESLEKAFRSSARRLEMFAVWTPEFPLVFWGKMPSRGNVIDAAVRLVLAHYSEREVLNILARTRLEGKWEPE